MSAYPLLTKVLLGTVPDSDLDLPTHLYRDEVMEAAKFIAAAIPPDIADRLERALDACQYHVEVPGLSGPCGMPDESMEHRHEQTVCKPDHAPHDMCHPYQPLVTP